MPRVLIIDKTGEIQSLNIKSFVEEELYKKCNFKSAEGFGLQTSWTINPDTIISVYGKTVGRANFENKYEFPPPIDKVLFFGSCILVRRDSTNTVLDLTAEQWERAYEKLMGGFEDLTGGGAADDEMNEDESEEEDVPRTKSGYVKDGFVVDDDEDEEDEDYEEEEKPAPKKKSAAKKSAPVKKAARKTAQQIAEEVASAEASQKKPRKKKTSNSAPAPTEIIVDIQEKNIYDDADELFEEEYET